MAIYYSTCAAGLERVVARMAQKAIPGFQLRQALNGALIYSAKKAAPHCVFFQNTYLLIERHDRVRDMAGAARAACTSLTADKRRQNDLQRALAEHQFRTFRVMFSDANKLVSIDPSVRARIERAVQSARVDRVHPDTEVLILRRSEGFGLLLLRLTKPSAKAAKPERGELSPAIAQCMVFLAQPTPDGVFLDPFAGHGSLGEARGAIGPVKRIRMLDLNPPQTGKRKYPVERGDALGLSDLLEESSVTEIVTDPPWGLYEPLPLPADEFYNRMLSEFAYVLAPRGMLVLLTADKDAFERALKRHANAFEYSERHDLLVNGKKAAIIVSRRV